MARKSKVGGMSVFMHLILTLVTGGAWLLVLLVWALLSSTRK